MCSTSRVSWDVVKGMKAALALRESALLSSWKCSGKQCLLLSCGRISSHLTLLHETGEAKNTKLFISLYKSITREQQIKKGSFSFLRRVTALATASDECITTYCDALRRENTLVRRRHLWGAPVTEFHQSEGSAVFARSNARILSWQIFV